MRELCLTELENCLIARNILFQKFVLLPKSRWTATKDHIVNIPIFDKDIISTIESFPRTLDEAGVIPVQLKRKIEYKNNHLEQYISTKKIFKALQTLKRLGNKYFQFVPDLDKYRDKCKNHDPDGYNLLFEPKSPEIFEEPEKASESDKEEEDYIRKSAARKWQFDYNKSTFFSNDFPELDVY
jgi:hypothetical protein